MSRSRPRQFITLSGGGRGVRHIALRPWMFFLAAFLVAAGIAGIIIPFSSFSLNMAEINYKRSLDRQNEAMQSRTRSMRSIITDLRGRLDELTHSRDAVEAKLGEPMKQMSYERPGPPISTLGVDSLVVYAGEFDRLFTFFADKLRDNPAFFDNLPVLRPVPGTCFVTAGYGKQKDPFTGKIKMHHGIDLAAPEGTVVLASGSGTISEMNTNHPHWGRRLVITHAYGMATVYAHLGSITVTPGRQVSRGDVIGTVGSSGFSTGPHLHYAILRNGSSLDPLTLILPEDLFAAR